LENLDSFKINIGISDHNELKLLETSFNSMIRNLSESVCEKEQTKAELIASHDRFLTVLDGIEAMTANDGWILPTIDFYSN